MKRAKAKQKFLLAENKTKTKFRLKIKKSFFEKISHWWSADKVAYSKEYELDYLLSFDEKFYLSEEMSQ